MLVFTVLMITFQKLRDSQIVQTTCSNTRLWKKKKNKNNPKLGSFFAFGFDFSYTSASVEVRLKLVILCEDGRDAVWEPVTMSYINNIKSPLNRGFWSEALKT